MLTQTYHSIFRLSPQFLQLYQLWNGPSLLLAADATFHFWFVCFNKWQLRKKSQPAYILVPIHGSLSAHEFNINLMFTRRRNEHILGNRSIALNGILSSISPVMIVAFIACRLKRISHQADAMILALGLQCTNSFGH